MSELTSIGVRGRRAVYLGQEYIADTSSIPGTVAIFSKSGEPIPPSFTPVVNKNGKPRGWGLKTVPLAQVDRFFDRESHFRWKGISFNTLSCHDGMVEGHYAPRVGDVPECGGIYHEDWVLWLEEQPEIERGPWYTGDPRDVDLIGTFPISEVTDVVVIERERSLLDGQPLAE
ncbi:MAG: hypothetical protein ACRCSF_11850 [Mycobacteriaceae bacterium]